MKICIYCAEEIKDIARKCRYCGSLQSHSDPASMAEKRADLVIKFIGALSIVIGILVGVSSFWGFKTLAQFQDEAKKIRKDNQEARGELEDVKEDLAKLAGTSRSLTVEAINREVYFIVAKIDIDVDTEVAKRARRRLEKHKADLSIIEKRLEEKEKSKAHFLIEGLFAYDTKDYERAVNYLRKADQKENVTKRILAVALIRAGEKLKKEKQTKKADDYFEEADALMRRALTLIVEADQRPKLLNNLAGLDKVRGNLEGARKNLEELIASNPDSPVLYYNMATTFSLEGRYEKAVQWLNKAISKGMFKGPKAKATDDYFLKDKDFKKLREDWGSKNKRQYEELLREMRS